MDFTGLLGNTALKARLGGALTAGTLPHACVIFGPAGSGRHTLARILAAVSVCAGGGDKPCRLCRDCRKAFSGLHPDIITLHREKDKKNYAVEQIRALVSDAAVLPNEAARKVYILEDCDYLTPPCQNAALRLLEDPPAFASFILLAENPGSLLETLRSRCVEYTMSAVPERELYAYLSAVRPKAPAGLITEALKDSGGFVGPALKLLDSAANSDAMRCGATRYNAGRFIEIFKRGDPLETAAFAAELEALERPALADFLDGVADALPAELKPGSACTAQDRARLFGLSDLIGRLRDYMEVNVGTGLIAGALAACCNSLGAETKR